MCDADIRKDLYAMSCCKVARPKVQVIIERMTKGQTASLHPRLRSKWLLHQSDWRIHLVFPQHVQWCSLFCFCSFFFRLVGEVVASEIAVHLASRHRVIRRSCMTISTRMPPKKKETPSRSLARIGGYSFCLFAKFYLKGCRMSIFVINFTRFP